MNELRPAFVLRQTTASLGRQFPAASLPIPRLPRVRCLWRTLTNTDFSSSGKNDKDEFSMVVLGFLELVP